MPNQFPVRQLCAIALAAASACTTSGSPPPSTDALVADAQRFMSEYATELVGKDRAALVGRYDPRGVFVVGDGTKELWSADSVSAWYRNHWPAPAYFAFSEFSYEPLGDSAIAVLGRFRWVTEGTSDTTTYAYTAHSGTTRRQAGHPR